MLPGFLELGESPIWDMTRPIHLFKPNPEVARLPRPAASKMRNCNVRANSWIVISVVNSIYDIKTPNTVTIAKLYLLTAQPG